MHDIIRVSTWKQKEVKRFADVYSDGKKWLPPPNAYDLTDKQHNTRTYKIYQTERKTLEEVKQDIKRGVPPPGTYTPTPIREKIRGPYKSTTP